MLIGFALSARETYFGVSGYWADNDTDSGPGGGLRIGWHFPAPEEAKYQISTDVEVEGSYWEADSTVDYAVGRGKAETKVAPFLANIRVNVPLADTPLFLYGGGGLGVSWLDFSGTAPGGGSIDDTEAVFTYAFFAGLGGSLSERLELRAGYRSLWLESDSFGSGPNRGDLESDRYDMLELSLRIGF